MGDLWPFQTLAYFAIWNRSLADNKNDDAGLVYENSPTDSASPRSAGLAQGLTDFFRMLSSADDRVLSVHSARKRLIFIRPENGFVIHACINLPRTEGNSADTVTYSTKGVNDQTLFSELERSHSEFKLFNGSLNYLLDTRGRPELEQALKPFFDNWIESWSLRHSTLGFGSFSDTLNAVQTTDHSPTILKDQEKMLPLKDRYPILLRDGLVSWHYKSGQTEQDQEQAIAENSNVLSIPQPSSLDFYSLIRHVQKQQLASKSILNSNEANSHDESKVDEDSKSSNTTTTAFMSALVPTWRPKLPNTLSWKPPSLPWPSFETSTTTAGPRAVEMEHDDSNENAPKSEQEQAQAEESESELNKDITNADSNAAADTTFEISNRVNEALTSELSELNPMSDDDDGLEVGDHIINNNGAIEDEGDHHNRKQIEKQEMFSMFNKSSIYLGFTEEEAKWINVLWTQDDAYTMIFLTTLEEDKDQDLLYSLCSSTLSILSEIKTQESRAEEVSENNKDIYQGRYLIHEQDDEISLAKQNMWPGKDTFVSGEKRQISETDLMTVTMNANEFFSMNPPTLETCARTGSSQWIVADSRTIVGNSGQKLSANSYLVLPKSVGNEGSLMDVDTELRKFLNSAFPG